ncbi:MAG: class I tRNA ligase family protein [Patescibacteria group bacterium]|nr:class I tRNA ligase family protein [Patescibacteria group bacterium]
MPELPKAYNPAETESRIYQKWLDSGFFNPDNLPNQKAQPFTIMMPPPNVTGTLHVGHALFVTIQDILIRFRRMQGRRALWLPGTDHAAIATQARVEKDLYKNEGKTRFDFSREEFLKLVEKFAQSSHDTIINQIKRLGASADWSREAYTLDETRSLAVRTAFKKMYDDGIVYRGARIVNWDPKLKTTVSDEEIVWQEEKTPFYYLKYGPFTIATARPETKFGDKYVVMHPDDKRYKKYQHGDKIDLEWINGPVTATIIKDPVIDMEFGTGVMTITPWHDAVDFDLAERHGLDKEQIIDENGKLLPIAGEFAGEHIKKARAAIIEKIKAKGLLEKVDENYTHRIATNQRGGGVIEPQIKEQWFIDVNKKFTLADSKLKNIKSGQKVSLKELMKSVVESGEIKIIPEHFSKVYFHWIDNLRDWCISRQIWYGHRIPVWYKTAPKGIKFTFLRHGQSEGNVKDIGCGHQDDPLTNHGREQANKLKNQVDAKNFDLVFSSDLSRATETAQIIFGNLHKIKFDKRLREIDFGDLSHKKTTEIDKYRVTGFPNGETYQQVRDRVIDFLSDLIDKYDGKKIAIVAHSGVWKALEIIFNNKNFTEEHLKIHAAREPFEYLLEKVSYVGTEAPKGKDWQQDPDTLDTWFSSGLWTFSTLGWPEKTKDLKTFHPTDVMETGYDILFFWVARMILMTTYFLGEIPFRTVFLHGLVRDKDRQKMSKSKDNVIDPLGVIDTYGADALRFALIFSTAAGNDIPLAEDKIKGMKFFANKLWNITRFVLVKTESLSNKKIKLPDDKKLSAEDKNILNKLNATTKAVTDNLENFRLHEAAQEIYQFAWHDFADVYLEDSKNSDSEETKQVLFFTLEQILKLLHPFMPFVTEELWVLMGHKKLLMIEKWPE